jgi:peroxiredoxin
MKMKSDGKEFYRATWLVMAAWLGTHGILQGQDANASKQPEVGQRAIDFELPLVNGEGYLSLRDTYKEGPTVVIFLRGFPGYQCPICSRQVSSMVNRAKVLAGAAHRVVLVYPGPAEGLDRRAEEFLGSRRLPLPLVLVRDDDLSVVNQWGLRWNSPRETAYPATFVLDQYGRVTWKKVSGSHGERSSTEDILKELRKL